MEIICAWKRVGVSLAAGERERERERKGVRIQATNFHTKTLRLPSNAYLPEWLLCDHAGRKGYERFSIAHSA